MIDEKQLVSDIYRLKDQTSLKKLFVDLNYDNTDEAINKENWSDSQKDKINVSRVIAKLGDFRIFFIENSDTTLKELKEISTKIISKYNGRALICMQIIKEQNNWIISSLSKDFSKNFKESRHFQVEVKANEGVPESIIKFFKNIVVEKDNPIQILKKVSEAFDNFALEIHNELTVNIFDALKILSKGFIEEQTNNLNLDDETLEKIREPIFTFLYRVIFILYAEDRGIFPVEDPTYLKKFSLRWIKSNWIVKKPDDDLEENMVLNRLKYLFRLVEIGSEELDYSPDEFFMRSYYGRLFDRTINSQLEKWRISNKHLLSALDLLTRTIDKNRNYFLLDYSALETRHLGHIYEHLLEYHLTVTDGKITDLPDPTERKLSASYYTPQYLVDYIVENTLEPEIIRLQKESEPSQIIEKLLSLKILDPAMGSGHFLVTATKYLAKRICEIEGNLDEHNYIERKRDIVRRCIYGVDLNSLAVDLAKVSLWLETLSSEKPLSFLSSHLKHGNSLLGESIEGIFHAQEALFEETSRNKLKKAVRDYVGFELLEDDTKSAVKAKIEKFEKIQSKGSFNHQLRGILDYKLSEEFGIKSEPWRDLRQKIGVESLDFYASKSGISINELRNKHSFFHWDLEFLEVFYDDEGNRKKNAGFDIIIGNPPYVTTRKIPKEERTIFWKKYENFLKDEMNTFTLFYAKIDELIKKKGFWGFISPSGWYTNNPYDKLREWFFKKNSIRKIVDFPYRFFPFEDVNTETAIVIGTRQIDEENIIKILRGDKETLKKTKKITDELLENKIQQKSIFEVSKNKLYIYQTEISTKLNKMERKFGEIIEVHNPSSLDRKTRYPKTKKQHTKCVFSLEEINDDPQLKEICKPCLVGEDIQRFFCLDSNRFTNIKWNEKGTQKQLSHRTQKWMNQLKIVGQRITGQVSRRMIFSVDFENRITMPSANIILLKDYTLKTNEQRIQILHYLVALLNSKLLNYLYETQYGEANTNITSDVLEEMPLLIEIDSVWGKSEKLSKFYSHKNKNNEDKIIKLESEIDSDVYRIYGLTKSEIDIVESYYEK